MSEQKSLRRREQTRVPASAPRKSERTRQAILDAALEFLWDHPFRDLTIGELMSRVGASRSAFYQYFADLHDLMETLLHGLGDDIMDAAKPWFVGEGDPVPLLQETFKGLVNICYRRGPILRAVADAAASDERLEQSWAAFLKGFDDAVAERIEQQQAAGLIPRFPARPIAVALNRLDASLLIEKFGRRPRGNQEAVRDALTRIWVSTLYGRPALSQPVTPPRDDKHEKKSVS
jgi:AcrR family transcriptional regulator